MKINFSKKLVKRLAIGIVGFFILILFLAFIIPTPTELELSSFKDGDETIEELFGVSGEYSGLERITVNGEEANLDGDTFSKKIKLETGDNLIKIEGYKEGAVEITKEAKVYFDLEGMLYKVKEEALKREEEERLKVLNRTPEYEVVRKETIDNGFSAIVYVKAEDVKDYLISNAAKDIKEKENSPQRISLLFFSKNDKSSVEAAFESTDNKTALNTVSSKIKADYEKTSEGEELFYFPSGLVGQKLALEIK